MGDFRTDKVTANIEKAINALLKGLRDSGLVNKERGLILAYKL